MEEYQQRIGHLVGDYRLLKWLGGGGFGNVYLAEHIRDHDQVAIKILQMRLTDATHLRHFLNEASMFRLRHPHIMPLLNFGLSRQDEPFLVMDYAPKGTLRDRHPKGSRVSLPIVIDYVTQIASALQYAHEQHVVHRDVKPENMLLKSDEVLLLSDFGIATAAYSTHSVSMNAGVGGTVPYMAPEQMDGKPRPASDQYALAVVTYEWLTGRCPFVGTAVEVVVQHTLKLPPPLHELVESLPLEVEEVLFKALAKNPKERFASAQAFADALQQASTHPALWQAPSMPQEVPPAAFFANTMPPSSAPLQLALPSITRATPSMMHKPLLPLAPENGEMLALSEKHAVIPPQSVEPPAMKNNQSGSQAFDAYGTVRIGATSGSVIAPSTKTSSVTPPMQKTSLPGAYRALLVVLILLMVSAFGSYAYLSMNPFRSAGTATTGGTAIATAGVAPTATVNVVATATARAALTATVSAVAATATVSAAPNAYNTYVSQNGIMFGFDAQHSRTNPYERILSVNNVSQLHQKWIASTGGDIFSSPVVANGLVYLGSDDNKLYALDAASGQRKWVVAVSGGIRSSPAVANGLVYVGSIDNKLYAFDAVEGRQQWVAAMGSSSVLFAPFINSSPATANGLVYSGSGDGKLYAFDAFTGVQKWATATGDIINSSPAIAHGLVYVGSKDGKLYAFDATNGQPKWATAAGDAINSSSPAVANGLVYVGSENGKLYAFDAFTGVQRWATATGGAIEGSSPALANGLVYVGSNDFKLYAFDAFTGQHRWIATTNGIINSSPTVANGVVYIGSLDDDLYAFDANTGERKWTIHTGDSIYSSPVVVNGVVYVGSDDDKIYAFSLQ